MSDFTGIRAVGKHYVDTLPNTYLSCNMINYLHVCLISLMGPLLVCTHNHARHSPALPCLANFVSWGTPLPRLSPSSGLVGLASGWPWQKMGGRWRGDPWAFVSLSVCFRLCSWQQLCLTFESRSCQAAPPNTGLFLLSLYSGSSFCRLAWLLVI